MRNGGDKAVTLTFHHDIKRDGESLAWWIQQQQQQHFISPHNMHKIKIYNNSTDNDRGAGCPK